jgi:predicted transcriptional regulator
MSLFQESSQHLGGRAVLLSIKPKYADLILAGTKTVELRRSWPSNEIGVLVLYSSAPVQRLVGVAYVDHFKECDLAGLWSISERHGGGVTYQELEAYVHDKKRAYGIILSGAQKAEAPIDPKALFDDFVPPQSFLYIESEKFREVMRAMFPSRMAS